MRLPSKRIHLKFGAFHPKAELQVMKSCQQRIKMNLEQSISKKLAIKEEQVKAAVTLIDDGNTIPFIARYRKEVTGGLLDEQLEQILEWTARLRVLEERREAIFKSLKEQEIKDTHLLAEVRDAETMTELEDLYTPYRPKRKTRASVAKEKGLEGLAKALLEQSPAIKRDLIKSFFNAQVQDEGEAIAGAKDIAAEVISDTLRVRSQVRSTLMSKGGVESTRVKDAPDENGTYTNYYEFRADISKIRPHQLLAIHRAEQEKVLRYKLALPVEDWKRVVLQTIRPNPKSVFYLELLDAIEDAGERLLMPALEREIKSTLLEQAEDHAIEVFTKNLRNLLLQPPLKGNVVLGLDPGFRTGCKIAVTDPTGRVLAVETIYPHEPRKDLVGAYRRLTDLIKQHGVRLISLGNGTASKESEKLVAEVIKQFSDVKYIVTNEAGASVYSASALARKEFPNLDVSLRSAVSIARRVQDPLAELVKIDPKSIGVGMYQHDVDQKKLSAALNRVVSGVVNEVGVDLNTASPALLAYVSGIGPKLSESIVAYREAKGAFKNRRELKKVSGMGEKAFEQCAGFLRIFGGSEPLDTTSIHPESYQAAREIIKMVKVSLDMPEKDRMRAVEVFKNAANLVELAGLLNSDSPTIELIFSQVVQPDDDPRRNSPRPLMRSDILTMEDLKTGMSVTGTVRNVTDFGLFIDIGLKNDALLHRSKLLPGEALKVGDVIKVRIDMIDLDRGRVGLRLENAS
jgi:uncharacterized protein